MWHRRLSGADAAAETQAEAATLRWFWDGMLPRRGIHLAMRAFTACCSYVSDAVQSVAITSTRIGLRSTATNNNYTLCPEKSNPLDIVQ